MMWLVKSIGHERLGRLAGLEMLDDHLDRLATVAHVVIFELFNIPGIDGLTYNFVDDECVDGFLFPKL